MVRAKFYLLLVMIFVSAIPFVISAEEIRPIAGISYSPLKQVVPGEGLPSGLKLKCANNNLDLVIYKGRYFFAFRNAPTHFASRATRLIILSSDDAETWELEKIIHIGRDLREPRFLVYKDKLFFYYFSAGKNFWTFSPQNIWVTEYRAPKDWTEPKKIWEPGSVDWRAKEHNGLALMSTYQASGVFETKGGAPSELMLLRSEDGINWEHYDEKVPVQVYEGAEADFEFDALGNLYSVVRNESGATKICKAKADNLARWECTTSKMKYDSPLMFKHKEQIYLIARRNLAGEFVRNAKYVPDSMKQIWNMGRYWVTRKRTALYRFDTENMEIEWLFDFPSKGDTAFPALVKLNENQYLMFNYSSPINGPDFCWVMGQLTGTRIYSTVITFYDE